MSLQPSAPCLYYKRETGWRCYETVIKGSGYCLKHQPEPFISANKIPRPKNWNNLRAQALKRAGDKCEECKAPPYYSKDTQGGSLEVDHITPLALGGSNFLSNLRVLCPNCHHNKTRKDLQDIQRANQLRRRGKY